MLSCTLHDYIEQHGHTQWISLQQSSSPPAKRTKNKLSVFGFAHVRSRRCYFLKRKNPRLKTLQAANTRQMMGAVEEAFKKWDITGDGAISKYELHAALTQLGMSEAQVVGRVPLGGVW